MVACEPKKLLQTLYKYTVIRLRIVSAPPPPPPPPPHPTLKSMTAIQYAQGLETRLGQLHLVPDPRFHTQSRTDAQILELVSANHQVCLLFRKPETQI